jgi:hypothetical protein
VVANNQADNKAYLGEAYVCSMLAGSAYFMATFRFFGDASFEVREKEIVVLMGTIGEENLIRGSLFGEAERKRFETMEYVYSLFLKLRE